jgi:glucosamine 6-phosphate synthetase-like amidotransferase/phosphosugar isomerase protein
VYKEELQETLHVLGQSSGSCLDDISGGAANDISRATEIARKMVTQYGMSEKLGPIVFGTGHDEVFLGKDYANTRNYSETIAAQIDEEIHAIITKGYNMAEKILKESMNVLHFVADYLVKHEVMDQEQFELCFTEGVTTEMLDAVRERKLNESKEANRKRNEEIIEENTKIAKNEYPGNNSDNSKRSFRVYKCNVLLPPLQTVLVAIF